MAKSTRNTNYSTVSHLPLTLRTLMLSVGISLSGCATMTDAFVPSAQQSAAPCATCSAPNYCATCQEAPAPIPPEGQVWNTQPVPVDASPTACMPVPADASQQTDLAVAEVTRKCEEQIASLQDQLDTLTRQQQEASLSRDQMMQKIYRDVQDLSEEVSYWQSEVKRLDAAAAAQHERDMQSLDALIELVGQLPAASTAGRPSSAPTSVRN